MRKSRALALAASTLAVAVGGALALSAPAGATAPCPNEVIRSEQHSTYLPDCRAYEQVSPVEKYGWPVFPARVSIDGTHVIAESLGAFAGANQPELFYFYDFSREPGGWGADPLSVPAGYKNRSDELLTASPDASKGIYRHILPPGDDRRAVALYLGGVPEVSPVEIGPIFSPVTLASLGSDELMPTSLSSASSDLSRVLFEISGPQGAHGGNVTHSWPGDTTAFHSSGQGLDSLYEYVGTGNSEPQLVGIKNEGPVDSVGESELVSQCGTSLGNPQGGSFDDLAAEDVYNAISSDGSHVFFTVAPACEGGYGPPAVELFARIDNGEPGAHTVAVSEPTAGDCSACNAATPAGAVFQGASADGSKVFFLTTQKLLGSDSTQNLYEYDFGAAAGQRVTRVSAGAAVAGVQGVARVSEDGSHVYFVATGKLSAKANGVGDTASAGKDNLYVYDTVAQTTRFVATLSPSDAAVWNAKDERPVDATPNGRFLIFTSVADLTPDDTSSARQVFRYDAQSGDLVRVSVGQEGFNEDGNTDAFAATIAAPHYTVAVNPLPEPTSISDDGSYVVFQSADGLTPEALNGVPIDNEGHFAPNVYEWHEGRVSLISDGQDLSFAEKGNPSTTLFGVSASGADVFFTSADRLVPQDGDTVGDLYDARIGGGFAPPTQVSCAGDGCQGVAAAPPAGPTPGSSSFAGPGNPPAGFEKSGGKKHHRSHHHKRRAKANRGGAK